MQDETDAQVVDPEFSFFGSCFLPEPDVAGAGTRRGRVPGKSHTSPTKDQDGGRPRPGGGYTVCVWSAASRRRPTSEVERERECESERDPGKTAGVSPDLLEPHVSYIYGRDMDVWLGFQLGDGLGTTRTRNPCGAEARSHTDKRDEAQHKNWNQAKLTHGGVLTKVM